MTQRKKQPVFIPEEGDSQFISPSPSRLSPSSILPGAFPLHRVEALNVLPCHPSKEGHTLHPWSLPMASVLKLMGIGGERARGLHGYNSQGQKVEKSQSRSQNCVWLVWVLSAMMEKKAPPSLHEHHDNSSLRHPTPPPCTQVKGAPRHLLFW